MLAPKGASQVPVEDAEMTRMVRREVSRRYVDTSKLDVRVMHGVVYLRGTISSLRSHPDVDVSEEIQIIERIIRQRPGIRDVINEMELERESTLTRLRRESSRRHK
jgi:osmotically-inducible protein OsmY